MNRAGVVIVTHDSAGHIGACLEALATRCEEVVVVDNASRDTTCDQVRKHPRARLIVNERNLGFAAAVNQGVRALRSEFVLMMNPDVELMTGVEALVDACARPGVAAASGKLVDAAGAPQTGFFLRRFPTAWTLVFEALGWNRIWPGNPVSRRYRCLDRDPEEAGEVEQPAGAFLMFRRQAWEAAGGLDEGFHPVWFEDVDFLLRLKRGGYSVRYVPAVVARHGGGHSVGKLLWSKRQLYWYSSLLRYTAKHFGPIQRAGICAAVVAGALARLATGIWTERSLRPVAVCGKVVRLASRCLVSDRFAHGEGWTPTAE